MNCAGPRLRNSLTSPSKVDPDENQIKFSVYVRYVEALYAVTAMSHHSLRDAAAHQAAEKSFQRIQRRRYDSTLHIEHALPINFLPDPDDPKATIVFVRLMELQPDGRVIFMPSTFKLRTDREEPLELLMSQRVEIRGWRHAEIERAFRENGFSSLQTFGAFDETQFDPKESRDVIFIAR
jgi:hypothetical protein